MGRINLLHITCVNNMLVESTSMTNPNKFRSINCKTKLWKPSYRWVHWCHILIFHGLGNSKGGIWSLTKSLDIIKSVTTPYYDRVGDRRIAPSIIQIYCETSHYLPLYVRHTWWSCQCHLLLLINSKETKKYFLTSEKIIITKT